MRGEFSMKAMKIILVVLVSVVLVSLASQIEAAGDESLILYLPFDEGSGDTVADLSGKANNGTIYGAKWVEGQVNQALEFNGGSYVEIPHSESLSPTESITVMAWVFVDPGSSGELMIVSKGRWAANDLPYELSTTPGGTIYWQFYDDAGRDSCSPSAPPVNEWHHIAGTYDGSVFKCYVDGELMEEFAYKGSLPQNKASVTIGKRSTADECYLVGMIDEVAIFNRALSVAEVKEAMNGIKAASVDARGKLATLWGEVK
jgi:hypothetical protein